MAAQSDSTSTLLSLPAELRLRIWILTLQPRIIDTRLKSGNYPSGKPLPGPPSEIVLPPIYKSPLPTAFHICQESRHEIKPSYVIFNEETLYAANGTLVNFEIDTIFCPDLLFNVEDQILPKSIVGPQFYFPDRSVLFRMAMSTNFADNVTSLAISAVGLKAMGTMSENMIPALRKYRKLRELFLVGPAESGGHTIDLPEDWTRGEPRLLPGRPCPDGESSFWLHMYAGLSPVDCTTWQSRPVEDLQYELKDAVSDESWKPPEFKFKEGRRYKNWDLVNYKP